MVVAGAAAVAATVAIVDVDPLFEELSLNNDCIIFKYYLAKIIINTIV